MTCDRRRSCDLFRACDLDASTRPRIFTQHLNHPVHMELGPGFHMCVNCIFGSVTKLTMSTLGNKYGKDEHPRHAHPALEVASQGPSPTSPATLNRIPVEQVSRRSQQEP
jgi:hypothetical protein